MRKIIGLEKIGRAGELGKIRRVSKIGLLAGLILLLLASSAGAVSAVIFPDVKGHWGEKYIEWGVNQGLVKGYPDGTFQPNKSLSEAEFATMMTSFAVNASGTGATSAHWSDPYYTAMNKFNLPFKGYTNISFRDKPVDRGTIAQIVASKNGFDLPLALAIQYMYDNELSQGMDANVQNFNTYGADKPLTRAEAVTFLERLNSIGATSFMGITSPTTDGRHVLSQAERDAIQSQVKDKVNTWLKDNKNKLPKDQLAEIESWVGGSGQSGMTPFEVEALPQVQAALNQLPSFNTDPNKGLRYDEDSAVGYSSADVAEFVRSYLNIYTNYDGNDVAGMETWANTINRDYMGNNGNIHEIKNKIINNKSTSKATILFNIRNVEEKKGYWLVHPVVYNELTGKTYQARVQVAFSSENTDNLSIGSTTMNEVK